MQAVCRICRSADRNATPLITTGRTMSCSINSVNHSTDNHTTNHDDSTKQQDTIDLNELLAPCRCRGTMRWVHRGCLEEWRQAAAPGSDSYLRCDMCKTEYRFRASWWRRWLGGEAAVWSYTMLICGGLVVVAVMVAAECRRSLEEVIPLLEPDLIYNDGGSNGGGTMMSDYDNIVFLQTYPLMAIKNLYADLMTRIINSSSRHHVDMDRVKNVFAGLASLSLIQLLIVDGSVGLSFNLMFSLWRLIHYDFKLDYGISAVFVVIGVVRMVVEVKRVVRVATARLLTFQIIDYHDDRSNNLKSE